MSHDPHAMRRRRFRLAAVLVGLLAFLALYIEDWGRDFTDYNATISTKEVDELLGVTYRSRPVGQLVDGVRMAAGRIKNWHYVGEVADGNTTQVLFVRTSRMLRLRDDITLRISDLGSRRNLSGESRARTHFGDLGRNPRNLRRLLAEMKIILEGAVRPTGLARREQR